MFVGVTSEVIFSSNPKALQDLPQPIDRACSSEHLPDTVNEVSVFYEVAQLWLFQC